MLKIGITGNIASGKSLFEKYLKNAGFPVLCLDSVTHFLYENDIRLKEFLLKKFNTFERLKISSLVFRDVKLKKELEDFIYPLILDKMEEFFFIFRFEKILFVSAAVLFEAGFNKYFDKIVLILSNRDTRIQRLMKRSGLSYLQAVLRVDSQINEEDKIPLSDFVIENLGTEEELRQKTDDFVKKILKKH